MTEGLSFMLFGAGYLLFALGINVTLRTVIMWTNAIKDFPKKDDKEKEITDDRCFVCDETGAKMRKGRDDPLCDKCLQAVKTIEEEMDA